jgi:hypothetical protein
MESTESTDRPRTTPRSLASRRRGCGRQDGRGRGQALGWGWWASTAASSWASGSAGVGIVGGGDAAGFPSPDRPETSPDLPQNLETLQKLETLGVLIVVAPIPLLSVGDFLGQAGSGPPW